jgi:large subunit ribosomal protein L9
MKVVFLENYENFKADEIKTVKDGFARFLLTYSKAVPATEETIKEAEKRQAEKLKKLEEIKQEAIKVKEKIGKISLTFKEKSNAEGNLFGSITETMIAEKITEQEKLECQKTQIIIKDNLKTVGNFEVAYKIVEDVKIPVTIQVIGLNGEEEITELPKEEKTKEEDSELKNKKD